MFIFGIVFLYSIFPVYANQTLYNLSPCTTLQGFQHFVGITVEECQSECLRRTFCDAINYNNYNKHCVLRNSTRLQLNGLEPVWCYDIITNNESIRLVGPCNTNPCNETSVCVNSAEDPFYKCLIRYCRAETNISNASFRIKLLTHVGGKNELVCDNAFTPVGLSSVTCLSDGNWSSTEFECLKNCPSIPLKVSATVSSWSTNRFVVNTFVTYDCKSGYYNITERIIFCDITGTWSNFECLPYCRQTDIIPLTNGSPLPGKIYTIYEQAEYKCNNGYYLSPGSRFVDCNAKGMWSSPDVMCYAFCKQNEIPTVKNGTPLPGMLYNYTMRAKYDCNQGFYLSEGSPEITCGKDGQWSTPEVECYQFCQLPAVSNGYLLSKPIQPIKKDVSVTYACNQGYYTHPHVSEPTAVCQQTGEWIYPAECYKYCSIAPDHRWEKVKRYSSEPPYTVGTTVQYKCDNLLMHFSGSSVKTCSRHGKWDGEVHCCFKCFEYKDGSCKCSCLPLLC